MLNVMARWLFDPNGPTAHGFCLLWEPWLVWTNVLADSGIALAYFTIPAALVVFVRHRSDLGFRPMIWLFSAFIVLCGTTHLLDVVTVWVPAYGFEALIKSLTSIVSIVTAVVLWRILPQALAWPAPAQLQAANEALRASEARYRASFEHSPVPLHTLDGGGRITSVSNSWLSLLGYANAADVVGRHLTDFQAPGSDSWVKADRARLMSEGEVNGLERRFLHQDGSIVDALVSARLERRGAVPLIVCVVIDISQRRRAEEALRATEERLHQSQKMEAVGQLTGGIAHDFNNMLQAIAGGLELMERRVAQGRTTEIPRYFAAARRALDSAATLTHRMLAFARRQPLRPEAVEPDGLVRGMADMIRRSVGPAIQVEVTLRDGRWSALCDANQLENALLNLAINARDAMPDGGRLTIATADRTLSAADLADINEADAGCYVEISVTDTGTGIPIEAQAHVFEPFFTTKPVGLGTGLGLSQTYGFVRQSGGFLRLESATGQGTTVRIFLPRHQEIDADEANSPDSITNNTSTPETAALQTSGKHVLVVEDETGVRALIADALREYGYTVLEAEDGIAGLQRVQSGDQIDLLVTDVGLPRMNGRQLADAARTARPDLPVMLITGYAGTTLDDVELAPGVEVLRKPFALDVLTVRVAAMMAAMPEPGRPETTTGATG